MGTWIFVSVGKAYESLSFDWFWNPGNTLELSLWIHSPGSGVTLLLRFGNSSVYSWMECPWSATSWCLIL
jgi:hypothetical protein